jgi:hypothetical protein
MPEAASARSSLPLEHFLYLLSEMERILEREPTEWPSEQIAAIQRRLGWIILQLALAYSGELKPQACRSASGL